MKLSISPAAVFTTLVLGASLFQIGCATTGNQRSANTRTTMAAVEQDYIQAVAQVDVTGASMDALINPGQPDIKKAYEKFSDNVNKMKDMEKRLSDHADKMRLQQRNYFDEWRMQGNTFSNPQIQALSEQRRADLGVYFAEIAQASVGVKGSFKAYMSDIQQIKTYLSTDLTPKGVGSITPTVRQAVTDGSYIKDSVKPVLTSIGNARAEMAQGGN